MRLAEDLRVLYHLLAGPRHRGGSQADRLESFYRGQAEAYDGFRERLLQGRRELVEALALNTHAGGTWLDLGGGTAANLEFAGPSLDALAAVYVVDLCPSLLLQADQRVRRHQWKNVRVVEADGATFVPDEKKVDVVTLSYSLTMMPDWIAVLEHALNLLKPGGTLGIVDFYVSRKYESSDTPRHSWLTRTFWPLWFAFDDVFLNPDHLAYLRRHLTPQSFVSGRARLPYFPMGRVPFYRFVGTKTMV